MRMIILTVLSGMLLTSCVGSEEAAKMRASVARHVVCQGKQNCDMMWAKAVNWTQGHDSMRLEMQTDYTLSAIAQDNSIRITITKNPAGPDTFEFIFRLTCVNPQACIGLEMIGDENSFKNYMLGPV